MLVELSIPELSLLIEILEIKKMQLWRDIYLPGLSPDASINTHIQVFSEVLGVSAQTDEQLKEAFPSDEICCRRLLSRLNNKLQEVTDIIKGIEDQIK